MTDTQTMKFCGKPNALDEKQSKSIVAQNDRK